MKTLIVSQATFEAMLSGLIKSGVTFEAAEMANGNIKITFTGGY